MIAAYFDHFFPLWQARKCLCNSGRLCRDTAGCNRQPVEVVTHLNAFPATGRSEGTACRSKIAHRCHLILALWRLPLTSSSPPNLPEIPRGADWRAPAGYAEWRNTRTRRGPARTADGALKRGLARTRVDSRGLARTRGHAAQATPPPIFW